MEIIEEIIDKEEGRALTFFITMSLVIISLQTIPLMSTPANGAILDEGWKVAGPIVYSEENECYGSHIAMDATGNGMAVWQQYEGFRADIFANHYIAGYGWEEAERIEFDDIGNAVDPQVATDNSGAFIAVWQQYDGVRDNIWSNLYVPGIGWGSPEIVERISSGRAISPTVVMDSSGTATAAWSLFDGVRYNIWANNYTMNSGWGTPELLETDNVGHALEPQLAIDGSGNVMAVWVQWDGARDNVWSNRYTESTGWGTAVLVENNDDGTVQDPDISMDDQGRAYVVWNHQGSGTYSVWSNNFSIASGWGTPVLLENDNVGGTGAPYVAAGLDGAMAVWNQRNGTIYNIHSNRYVLGSGWGTSELIENENEGSANWPHIATDGSGNYIAVWRQFQGGMMNLWANRYVPVTGWGNEVPIETVNSGDCDQPQVAMSSSGTALVVWEQFYNDVRLIASNRFELPDTIPPILELESPPKGYMTELSEINVYGTTEPGVTLTINGYLANVRDDGFFSCNISLLHGNNTILVRAEDGSCNTAIEKTNVIFDDPVISLKDDMMKAFDDISELTLGISDLRSNISDMALILAGLRNDLDINTMNISQIEENLNFLSSEMGTLTEEIHSIRENLTAARYQADNNDANLNNVSSDIADLIMEIDRVSDALEDIEDDVDDLNDEMESQSEDTEETNDTNNQILIIIIVIVMIVAVLLIVVFFRRRRADPVPDFE